MPDAPAQPVQQYMAQAMAAARAGRTGEAALLLARATAVAPDAAEAWQMLGDLLLHRGDREAAVPAYRRAISLRPDANAYLNLGSALSGLDRLDESIDAMRAALTLQPGSSAAHQLLGASLSSAGQLDEAIEQLRRAIQLDSHNVPAHSLLLYATLFQGLTPPAEFRAMSEQAAALQTANVQRLPPPSNDRTSDRRLRVGYVSPSFSNHAVAPFLLPIFEHHDPWEVEIYCYSDVTTPDATTARLKAKPDTWREVAALSHAQLAQLIRDDRIDLLIDLEGHVGGGRLQTFAARPAPIQIAYIGYQATTGLPEMDYVLTDAWVDPPGQTEAYWVEKPWRLPEPFFCHEPHRTVAPLVSPLPALERGFITFGCLNNVVKVTPRTLDVWCRIMSALPTSRLMLLTPQGDRTRDRLHHAFAHRGVHPNRVDLVSRTTLPQYFARYHAIDIALDPIPFPGHTTTCDAAWMGVPTISMAGPAYAYRYGSSVMRHLDLADLIATDDDTYVSIATHLANDLNRSATLRASLRGRMNHSPITDGRRFTRNLEAAFREMWTIWCRGT